MTRLKILCEGRTECLFVRNILAKPLASKDIHLYSIDAQGVEPKYLKTRKQILNLLSEDRSVVVTTMLDLYAIPKDFPGRDRAQEVTDPTKRVESLEAAFLDDIGETQRFIPYIQLHEFEGLLFSDVKVIAQVVDPDSNERQLTKLSAILDEAGSPEMIDDGSETAPSKRLKKIFPQYQKAAAGLLIAQRIGLDTIRSKCGHFNDWISKLEKLAQESR